MRPTYADDLGTRAGARWSLEQKGRKRGVWEEANRMAICRKSALHEVQDEALRLRKRIAGQVSDRKTDEQLPHLQ